MFELGEELDEGEELLLGIISVLVDCLVNDWLSGGISFTIVNLFSGPSTNSSFLLGIFIERGLRELTLLLPSFAICNLGPAIEGSLLDELLGVGLLPLENWVFGLVLLGVGLYKR